MGGVVKTLRSSKSPYPRDPPVLNIVRRVNFGTGRKFGTDVAKRYGEGSEMLVFLGKRGRKTVEILKKLRQWQNTTDSSAVLFLARKGPFGEIRYRRSIFSMEGSFP